MNRRYRARWARPACLSALLLAAGLLFSACVVQVPVDLNATAQAMAHAWATQTAEAGPGSAGVQPAVSPTSTGAPTASPTLGTALKGPTDTTTPAQPPSPTSTPTAPPPPPTATQTVTPKPTSTSTIAPKSTNTPTPSRTPSCPLAVDAALTSGWNHGKLGCPKASATIVWSAWQPFQHGYMLWKEDNDWVYALNYRGGTDSKAGDWATGGDSWRWDGVSFPDGRGLTPPEGLVEPIRGFGDVWFARLGGPSSQLGWGTEQEKGFCALVQPFEYGMLVQSNAASGCAGGQFNWAANPSFPPLFVALYGDGSWQRF
jgi:hypothetical protein